MNRALLRLVALAAVCVVAGCGDPPAYTICLVDVSASITSAGFESEFAAVDGLAEQMRRGDRLTLIPITGNAMGYTPGHVITLTAPTSRQPYDNDLVQFRVDARAEISKLRAEFTCRPAKRSDILGTIGVARDELAASEVDLAARRPSQTLIIFSDFIENDDRYHFGAHAGVAPNRDDAGFARQVRKELHGDLPRSLRVRLVEIESNEKLRLSPDRQRSIRAFWDAYFGPNSARWTPVDTVVHLDSR